MTHRAFLLSPADSNGIRAGQLTNARAAFALAIAYRSAEGVTVADAFSFMSALYFRGKIAYARRFAAPPPCLEGGGIAVILPGFGLVPPEFRLDKKRLARSRRVRVDPRLPGYRRPLEAAARTLAEQIGEDTEVVLLGSIATGKYVDVLEPVFGARLMYPRAFAGLGDMSRGSLMLKAVASGVELEYASVGPRQERQRRVAAR